MRGLLPIGRFSAASRLSIKALRHYDELGLLRPAHVDPATNRRYYSPAQLAEAEVVRTLRDLDLPLAEVRALLADGEPAARRRLTEHRGRLAADLDRRRRALADLDALLERPHALPAAAHAVAVRERAEQPVVAVPVRTTLATLGAALDDAFGRLFAALARRGVDPAGPPIVRYRTEEFDPEAVDAQAAVPVARPVPGADGVAVDVVPAGPVAATVHRGDYAQIERAYRALGAWIAEHGHETAAPPEEVYLVGPDRAGAAGLRTEVVWPLRLSPPARGSARPDR